MSYTNPNDLDRHDKPEDWLNSALIFARALGLILRESEGVVVDLVSEMKYPLDLEVKKVIVFNRNSQIVIISCDDDIAEGQFVMVHDENPN